MSWWGLPFSDTSSLPRLQTAAVHLQSARIWGPYIIYIQYNARRNAGKGPLSFYSICSCVPGCFCFYYTSCPFHGPTSALSEHSVSVVNGSVPSTYYIFKPHRPARYVKLEFRKRTGGSSSCHNTVVCVESRYFIH